MMTHIDHITVEMVQFKPKDSVKCDKDVNMFWLDPTAGIGSKHVESKINKATS